MYIVSTMTKRSLRLHAQSGNIAVGLSGGPDSMALLHMLSQEVAPTTKIHALIVDHNLRDNSAEEAQSVLNNVNDWKNVTPVILKWASKKPTTRILEEARAARFSLLQEYCSTHSIQELYLAHHLDDQAETFLFRLAKGSGLDGLAGMKTKKAISPQLNIIRPLLEHTKQELLDYCKEHKISYVQDPTNQNTLYMRPRLRESKAILEHEGLTNKRVAQTAKRILRARTALEEITEQTWQILLLHNDQNFLQLNLDELSACPSEIRIRILLKTIDHFSTKNTYPPRLEKVERLHDSIFHIDKNDAIFQKQTLAGLVFQRKKEKNVNFLIIRPEDT